MAPVLEGASLELYEQQADSSYKRSMSGYPQRKRGVLDSVLTYGKTYKYHETKAPDGYKVSKDILFTIDKQGRDPQCEIRW